MKRPDSFSTVLRFTRALCLLAAVASSSTACNEMPEEAGQETEQAALVAECRTDADCRTHSSYCHGCVCLALARSQPAPICKGGQVQCLLDPCLGKTAVCSQGSCTLTGGGATF